MPTVDMRLTRIAVAGASSVRAPADRERDVLLLGDKVSDGIAAAAKVAGQRKLQKRGLAGRGEQATGTCWMHALAHF